MGNVRRMCYGVGILMAIFTAIIGTLLLVAAIRALTIEDVDYQGGDFETGVLEELPASYLETLPEIFASALRIPTVSTAAHDYDREALLHFHRFVRETFPNVFNSSFINVEVINDYSFLFTITGSDTTVQPYLLASHMDVVPADESKWSHAPFGGEFIPDPVTGEMYVVGRGAIDDKIGVMSILMALQYLTSNGFQPRRSFYVAFGHDEEVTGEDGAAYIAEELKKRGLTFDFLLDEGMPVLDGVMQGIDVPVAAIGVTEKGMMMLKLEVEGAGGHSSMPPKEQELGRLAKALYNLERYPQPSMFGTGPEADILDYVAPKALWPYKMVFANIWLFKPILEMVMSQGRETNSLIRTTTALTIVRMGIKENVVPSSGYAIVNHRVHPSQSLEDVVQHDINVINDPKVKVTVEYQRPAHPVSPYGPKVPGWRLLASTVKHFFPDAIPAPGVLVGNTDTEYYLSLTPCVYRFIPALLDKAAIATVHGHNERISVSSVKTAVRFYHRFILSADIDAPPVKTTRPGHRSGEF